MFNSLGLEQRGSAGPLACRSVRYLALCASIVAASACTDVLDRLMSVEAPSDVEADVLERPENAVTLLDGAVGDFECALSHYVTAAGLFTQEIQYSAGSVAWRAYDRRRLELSGFDAPHAEGTCTSPAQAVVPGVYKPLSTARRQADRVVELVEGWSDADVPANREALIGEASAYSGYSHLLLGEGMCTAAFDLGPELGPDDIFERAVNRFARAVQAATTLNDAALLNLARVGQARALLNLGRHGDASSVAQQVSDGFRKDAGYSSVSPRRENRVFVSNHRLEHVTVGEGFREIADPRLLIRDEGRNTGLGVPIWHQLKYPTASAPIPIARWEEAQLIVAEAELAAGNLTAAVEAINNVRTRPGVGLAAFDSEDPDEIREQLLYERQVELYLESHSLGDLRRLDLPLVPEPGTPYPFGGAYGEQRCFPLPLIERLNNPNIGT